MAQALLPMIPAGATPLTEVLSVVREGGQWTYFCGVEPVYGHPEADLASFRMFTAQLIHLGQCRPVDIIRTFGVSKNSVLRSVAKYEAGGSGSFFRRRAGRGATVLTPAVTLRAEALLAAGRTCREVAVELGVKADTLRKAIAQGRVQAPPEREASSAPVVVRQPATDKSARSEADAAEGERMGVACTRPVERVLAAVGQLPEGAPTRFEPCRDVTYGGVLCALPALSANGLFEHLQVLPELSGYYRTVPVIHLLANLALCRLKAVEQLQFERPGELGKLVGLDRIPEVRCLRKKLGELSQENAPAQWAAALSDHWLRQDPDLAGALYVDGHVRLYHGKLTQLPARYVARQRLCLRGTTDYWVNDALGQPFFSVERPIDQGLLEALRSEIMPRLLAEVPGQPSDEELAANPSRSRFVVVFDREGYSPAFFRELWEKHRIASLTYHKHPHGEWAEHEFRETEVRLPGGETVTLPLAERGTWVGSRQEGLWMRELRKLADSGHQVSLITTAFDALGAENAGLLFSRWSQENFFAYMREHFAIDALNEYGTELIPGTNKPVVNPTWRALDRQQRSVTSKLTQRQARFAALTLHPEAEDRAVAKWERAKAALVEEIQQLEHELETLKEQKQSTPSHLNWEELPDDQKCQRLAPSRKRLLDTVKLIAYRAETALARIVREHMTHEDEARALLRELFRADADLEPDPTAHTLTIRVHSFATPRSNRTIQHLLDCLNETEFTYPGTTLQLRYTLAASNPK